MARPNRKEVAARVLAAIATLTEEHGYPPTFREVSAHVGLAHGAVHEYVTELRKAGLVHDEVSRRARSLRLTVDGRAALANAERLKESA